MKRDQIVTFFFFGLLAFVLYHIFLILSPFLKAMFWSAIIAFACYPVYDSIRKLKRISDTWAALITTLLVLLFVLPTVFVILVTLAGQAIDGYEEARAWIDGGGLERLQVKLRSYEIVRWVEEQLPADKSLTGPEEWDVGAAIQSMKSIGTFVAVQIAVWSRNIFLVLVNFVLMVALIFFFFRDGERIYRFLYTATPMEQKNKELVFQRIRDTFSAVIRGQFLSSLAQGLLAWIIYWILGLPLALFFGFLTALASMIPITGAGLVWMPLTVYLLLSGDIARAIILFVLGAGGISLVDNILKPILIGGKTRVPMLLLFLGILGGLKVYGLTGIFLAPLLLSLFFVLFRLYRDRYPELVR